MPHLNSLQTFPNQQVTTTKDNEQAHDQLNANIIRLPAYVWTCICRVVDAFTHFAYVHIFCICFGLFIFELHCNSLVSS